LARLGLGLNRGVVIDSHFAAHGRFCWRLGAVVTSWMRLCFMMHASSSVMSAHRVIAFAGIVSLLAIAATG
jgi:cyanophycinase-like exopeptidase